MSFNSYRLNVFGWVASELLKEDNLKAGDLGVDDYDKSPTIPILRVY
jgi:hypothetical protein